MGLLEGFLDGKVRTVSEPQYLKEVKAGKVLVKPKVISDLYLASVRKPKEEIIALLGGRVVGKYLEVQTAHIIKSVGSESYVKPDPEEFSEVTDKLLPQKLYVVGWAHSHPGHGIFLSGTDIRTQSNYQELFPDSVAMVIDPFTYSKIEYKFFRVRDGGYDEMDYRFLIR